MGWEQNGSRFSLAPLTLGPGPAHHGQLGGVPQWARQGSKMAKAPQFRVALLQLPAAQTGQDRLALAEQAVREAAAKCGPRTLLCVLPELFASAYFCQTMDPAGFALAEPIPGPTTQRLGQLCAELQVALVASLFERTAPGLYYNTAVVFDVDGSIAGKYQKSHIPCDPQYEEKFYFAPGDTGFAAFDTAVARVGVLICWDQWYPEAARLTAMQGAEIIVYPTAIGGIDSEPQSEWQRQREAWQTVQRGHAIANGVFVATVNRAGREPGPNGGIAFWGHSFCAGPQGEWLAQLGESPETAIVTCDRERAQEVRQWWPFWRDRRVDLFGPLTQRVGPVAK